MSTRTLSPRRRSVLAAMGIDVWVRRGSDVAGARVAPGLGEASPRTVEPPVPRTSTVQSPQRSVAPAGVVSIAALPATTDGPVRIDLLALAAAGGVVVGRFETPAERRIGQGVLRALAGPRAEPNTARFVWPPSSSIGGGAAAAASAYRAFLKGQLDRAAGTCLVLLGDAAAAPLALDIGKPLPVPVVCAPTALELIANPQAKKSLWRSIAAAKKR